MLDNTIVIDGKGHIAGRLSSFVAKYLLQGNRVIIVNAEKIMLSGNKSSILDDYLKKLEISSIINPRHGPFHPRKPDTILTKMIKGMLPHRKSKGLTALKRLRTFIGIPSQYSSINKMIIEDAMITKPLSFYLSLGEVASRLGWKSENN